MCSNSIVISDFNEAIVNIDLLLLFLDDDSIPFFHLQYHEGYVRLILHVVMILSDPF